MKKLILIFITIIYSFITLSNTLLVSASTVEYLRVITEDTALYKDQNLTNIACFLPYTYYVKVIEDLGDKVHVECYGNDIPKIDGFILKEVLFEDDLTVTSPFANVKIKTASNTEFYKDNSLKDVIQYIFPDRTLCFYGHLLTDNGAKIYYVSYNGSLGYVKEENVLPFDIQNHPNELTFITPPEEEIIPPTIDQDKGEETPENNDQYVLRVIIILAIILAGFIAVFTFKPPKKRRNTTVYYDDNEYR